MRQFLLLLGALLVPVVGLSAPRDLRLQQLPGQEVNYADGVGWISTGRDIRVAATVAPDARKSAWMTFVVWNNSNAPITVQESSITVEANGGRLKTYTAQELLAAEQSRQKWQKFGVGLAAGLNAYSASQQGSYTASGRYEGNFSANTLGGPTVYGNTSGTVSVYGTDPAARQQAIASANQTNQAMIANLQAQQAMRTQALDQRLFKANTIQPGDSYGGDVLIELPRKGKGVTPLGVQFWIDNEPHTFFVFVDGAPTPAMLARIAQLPSQGAVPTGSAQVDSAKPEITIAANQNAAPARAQPVNPTSGTLAAQPGALDPRSVAAAKLMASEALRAISRGMVANFSTMVTAAGSDAPEELRQLFSDPEKCQQALFELLTLLGTETRLAEVLEESIASAMTYDEIMDSMQYFRSPAGQKTLALLANTSAFGDLESRLVEVSDERFEVLASQVFAKHFPGHSWEKLNAALDEK